MWDQDSASWLLFRVKGFVYSARQRFPSLSARWDKREPLIATALLPIVHARVVTFCHVKRLQAIKFSVIFGLTVGTTSHFSTVYLWEKPHWEISYTFAKYIATKKQIGMHPKLASFHAVQHVFANCKLAAAGMFCRKPNAEWQTPNTLFACGLFH